MVCLKKASTLPLLRAQTRKKAIQCKPLDGVSFSRMVYYKDGHMTNGGPPAGVEVPPSSLEKDYYGCYCLKFIVKNGTHITEDKVLEDFGQFGEVVDVRGPGLFSGLGRLFVLLECPLGKVPPVSPKLGLISDDEPFGAPAGPRTAVARFAQAPHGHPNVLG